MADTKISALTAATAIAGNEAIPTSLSGANVRVSPELLASVMVHPGYVAGRWYSPPVTITTGAAQVADQIRLMPFMVASRCTVSDLGVRITTAAASGHIRLGIYASNATTKMPTGSALSTCIVATDSTGTISTALGSNVALTPGLYYFASQSDNSTVVCSAFGSNSAAGTISSLIGDSSLSSLSLAAAQTLNAYTTSVALTYSNGMTSVTAATFTDISTTGQQVMVFFKVTSVP
jgi:hypothetical protein